jgi:hypothetical protein
MSCQEGTSIEGLAQQTHKYDPNSLNFSNYTPLSKIYL